MTINQHIDQEVDPTVVHASAGEAGTEADTEDELDADRVSRRASLSTEERRAGSDDPVAQASAILAESDERAVERDRHPMTAGEHRSSEESAASELHDLPGHETNSPDESRDAGS